MTGQLVGVKQVELTHSVEGPARGHTEMVYFAQGPPRGGVTVTLAVVGLVGVVLTTGELQGWKLWSLRASISQQSNHSFGWCNEWAEQCLMQFTVYETAHSPSCWCNKARRVGHR